MNLSEAERALIYGPDSWCGRTSPEHLAVTKDKILEQSCKKPSASFAKKPPLFLTLRTDGPSQDSSLEWGGNQALLGEFSMHSFGEYPSVDVESHLSQILEARPQEKYYLSAKACQGILRRADRRGKKLPPMLKTALYEMIAYWEQKGQAIPPLTLKVRCGTQGSGGRGALIQTDQSATLSTFQDQTLFQPCDAAPGAGIICVATQQGGAEIREDDKAPTLTAAAGMSGNNQPVIAMGTDIYNGRLTGDKAASLTSASGQGAANTGPSVIQKTYCIQGNCIDRADTAGCNGKGWTEDVSYTLNTIDRPAVVVGVPLLNDQGRGRQITGEDDATAAPTLHAEMHGNIPAVAMAIENHPHDSRVKLSEDGIVQTLSERMGTGGGNTPMILECYSQDAYDKYTQNDVAATIKNTGGVYGGGSEVLIVEGRTENN